MAAQKIYGLLGGADVTQAIQDLDNRVVAVEQSGGSGIVGVNASTLTPGSSATASMAAGTLTLGIPRGAPGVAGSDGVRGADGATGPPGITAVSASTLAAGASATATLVGTSLSLGIPAGADGGAGGSATSTNPILTGAALTTAFGA